MQIEIKKTEGSLVELSGNLPWGEFEKYEAKAIKKLGENLEIPGFRKGHVPETMLRQHVSDSAILEEMAQLFLSENYPKILIEHKIDALGHPEVTLTKLARGNPFEFKIKTAVLPEIELPDYKKIAALAEKANGSLEVTDEEVEKTILQLRQMRAPKVKHEGCESETCTHEGELPEFNDEFVKSLGQFENVAQFREKLKQNIKLEKEAKEREKRRIKIVENIVKDSKIDVPDLLIEFELDKMLGRLKFDAEQAQVKFEDYLKQINKTEENIRKDWREGATARVKAELVLVQIAKVEKLAPEKAEIETELNRVLEFYKGADPSRSRTYVENMLQNEKVFQFLENLV